MCIIIIEEKEAADNVEELAKVPGIDVLFIGFADMTYSQTGTKGGFNDPKVQKAIDKVLAVGKKYGIPVGGPCGCPDMMKKLVKRGFRFFEAPTELGFL